MDVHHQVHVLVVANKRTKRMHITDSLFVLGRKIAPSLLVTRDDTSSKDSSILSLIVWSSGALL